MLSLCVKKTKCVLNVILSVVRGAGPFLSSFTVQILVTNPIVRDPGTGGENKNDGSFVGALSGRIFNVRGEDRRNTFTGDANKSSD